MLENRIDTSSGFTGRGRHTPHLDQNFPNFVQFQVWIQGGQGGLGPPLTPGFEAPKLRFLGPSLTLLVPDRKCYFTLSANLCKIVTAWKSPKLPLA